MSVLVRIYIPNKDKANISVKDLQEGLKLLNRTEDDISQTVEGLNCTDIFFKGTNSYIRINNSKI